MKFYPIAYHSHENSRRTCVIVFAYREDGEKVAIQFPYTYWFYASLENHSYAQVQEYVQRMPSARLETPRSGEPISTVIQTRTSTQNLHMQLKVIRVHCDNFSSKQDAVRVLMNNGVDVFEYDNVLTPMLKLIGEKDISKYCWMETDTHIPANLLTKMKYEYIGDVESLKRVTTEIAPPQFSTMTFDIEVDNYNWKIFPDAEASIHNAIKMVCLTVAGKKYEEHALIWGPDISPVYKRYSPSDIESGLVKVHLLKDEFRLILKLFEMIQVSDPDFLAGHNIFDFDIKFIISRYKLLVLNLIGKDTDATTIRIPNISRLQSYACSVKDVNWSNSQVSLKGLYVDAPGRTWIDTLIVARRGLLGPLRNHKLNTIGETILGMSKNDVEPHDMFLYFQLHKHWQLVKAGNKEIDKDILSRKIKAAYVQAVKKHNKSPPKNIEKPTVHHVNTLINMINGMNQRDKKLETLSLKKAAEVDIKKKYDELRGLCEFNIAKWNIQLDMSLSEDEMIETLWWLITMYCLQDTRIPWQVIDQQSIISVLREQASVFSSEISDVLTRGQVYIVTNSQYKAVLQKGMMMDFGPPGGPIPPYEYEGGLVGGEPGLKITDNDSIITVFDFASLYPTIMIAHNICYSTWIPLTMREPYLSDGSKNPDYIWNMYSHRVNDIIADHEKELDSVLPNWKGLSKQDVVAQVKDPLIRERVKVLLMFLEQIREVTDAPYEQKGTLMSNIYNVPNEYTKKVHVHWFIKPSFFAGVVPTMLWQQYLARKSIKKRMDEAKSKGDMVMYVTYNSQQLAVKNSMNASYGALGTSTNRLGNYAAAETITYIGRVSITECNKVIEAKDYGKTTYNDTDSAMVKITDITKKFNKDPKKIKEYTNNMAKELSSMFPYPMMLECENIFISFFVKTSKHYAAIKWDGYSFDISNYTWDYVKSQGLIYVKGLAPARKDKYGYSKELFNQVLYGILTRQSPSLLVNKLEYALQQIWNLREGINNPVLVEKMFSYNMGVTVKALAGGKHYMAQWCNIYASKYGSKPGVGERFDLLVTDDGTGKHTRSANKLVTMDWLLSENRKLDVIHYILALASEGQIVELLHLAYPNEVPRRCIEKYYLPLLKKTNAIL